KRRDISRSESDRLNRPSARSPSERTFASIKVSLVWNHWGSGLIRYAPRLSVSWLIAIRSRFKRMSFVAWFAFLMSQPIMRGEPIRLQSEKWVLYSLSVQPPSWLLIQELLLPPYIPTTNISMSLWQNRSEEHTSELQSRENLVCRLLLEKKK